MEDIIVGVALLIGAIIALAASIFAVIALWAWLGGPPDCKAFGEGMKLETTYSFWGGCFVKMKDGELLTKDGAIKVLTQRYKADIQVNE